MVSSPFLMTLTSLRLAPNSFASSKSRATGGQHCLSVDIFLRSMPTSEIASATKYSASMLVAF